MAGLQDLAGVQWPGTSYGTELETTTVRNDISFEEARLHAMKLRAEGSSVELWWEGLHRQQLEKFAAAFGVKAATEFLGVTAAKTRIPNSLYTRILGGTVVQ